MADYKSVELISIPGIPEVLPGQSPAMLIERAIAEAGLNLEDGDIITVAHKIVSKAEGRIVDLNAVEPSDRAIEIAARLNKDPRKIEVILWETRAVIREKKAPGGSEGLLICEHKLGFICANAGVDSSNVPVDDMVVLLPLNPDNSAERIQRHLNKQSGKQVGIVISDTFGRPWRGGLLNSAIGISGVPGIIDHRGGKDYTGRVMTATKQAFADELAAASGLLMGKADRSPVVLFRNLNWGPTESRVADILRPASEDLFR